MHISISKQQLIQHLFNFALLAGEGVLILQVLHKSPEPEIQRAISEYKIMYDIFLRVQDLKYLLNFKD